MGNGANQGPIIDKITYDNNKDTYSSSGINFGVCEMQGWRRTMEDSSIAIVHFDKNNSIFGVMDGHGGNIISKFVSQNFLNVFTNNASYQLGNYEQALIETFLLFDEMLREEAVNIFLRKYSTKNTIDYTDIISTEATITKSFVKKKKMMIQYDGNEIDLSLNDYNNKHVLKQIDGNEKKEENNAIESNSNNIRIIAESMGTTANVILIAGNYLYIANVGDSISVMYKNSKAIQLNQEHKITIKSEYDRIIKSGRKIINNRIEGRLNLTRAIGDLRFKQGKDLKCYEQSVTAYPEIRKIKLTEDIEFILMGCDGLWDCVDQQKICEMISAKIKEGLEGMKLSAIISKVFDQIISRSNIVPIGTDNMTCILIVLLHSQQINQGIQGNNGVDMNMLVNEIKIKNKGINMNE